MINHTNFHKEIVHSIILEVVNSSGKELDISYISSRAGYSKWHFQKLFKEVTGECLGFFLRKSRIDYAIQLMLEKEMSIIDVVYECDYNSPQSFSRAFKSIYGTPPKEYLKYKCAEGETLDRQNLQATYRT